MKRIFLSAVIIIISIILCISGFYTMASFTSTATSSNNTFRLGTVIITAYGSSFSEPISFTNIYPGWHQVENITVKNIGTLPFKYRMCIVPLEDDTKFNNILYGGTYGIKLGINDDKAMGLNCFSDNSPYYFGILNSSESNTIILNFSFPREASNSADEDYSGKSIVFRLRFDAIQEDSPGWDDDAASNPVSSISVHTTAPIAAAVIGSNQQMIADVLPVNARDKSVSWSVENLTGKADINSETGVLIPRVYGTVKVKAIAKDGSGVIGEQTINIYNRVIMIDREFKGTAGEKDANCFEWYTDINSGSSGSPKYGPGEYGLIQFAEGQYSGFADFGYRKHVTIKGAGKDKTIIPGTLNKVSGYLNVEDLTLKAGSMDTKGIYFPNITNSDEGACTIRRCTFEGYSGSAIHNLPQYSIIDNCIFKNNLNGVIWYTPNKNRVVGTITNCTFTYEAGWNNNDRGTYAIQNMLFFYPSILENNYYNNYKSITN